MRVLAMLLVAVGVAYAIYQYSLKKMPTSDAGTAPTQAIALTGVRSDLIEIAQAERANVALNGKCSSVEEMIANGALKMERPERSGYRYEVNCQTGTDFEVVARHAAAPEGSSIRYPALAADGAMQVREIQ